MSAEDDMSATGNLNHSQKCFYELDQNLEKRFFLIGVVMSVICCAGTLGNLSIIVTLLRKQKRSASNRFIVALAVFDSLVLIITVLLYSVEVIFEHTKTVWLYYMWFNYAHFIYAASHVCQISAIYVTLAATAERFISLWFPTTNCTRICTPSKVPMCIAVVFLSTFLVTVCKYWEISIVFDGECSGFGRYRIQAGPLLSNEHYIEIYLVWLSNLLFIFIPFIALSVLNALIWWKMRLLTIVLAEGIQNATTLMIKQLKKNKRRNREETLVLFVVVLVFLVCNMPQVALTLTERIDQSYLDNNKELYSLWRDGINLLTVINSSSNFLIYMIFGREFRRVLFNFGNPKHNLLLCPYIYLSTNNNHALSHKHENGIDANGGNSNLKIEQIHKNASGMFDATML